MGIMDPLPKFFFLPKMSPESNLSRTLPLPPRAQLKPYIGVITRAYRDLHILDFQLGWGLFSCVLTSSAFLNLINFLSDVV